MFFSLSNNFLFGLSIGEKIQMIIEKIITVHLNKVENKLFSKNLITKVERIIKIVELIKQLIYFLACKPPVNFLKIKKVINKHTHSFKVPNKQPNKIVLPILRIPWTVILIAYSYNSLSSLLILWFLTRNNDILR